MEQFTDRMDQGTDTVYQSMDRVHQGRDRVAQARDSAVRVEPGCPPRDRTEKYIVGQAVSREKESVYKFFAGLLSPLPTLSLCPCMLLVT